MKHLPIWLLVGIALLVSGCGPAAKEELAKLEVGMTQAQVQKVLGKPEKMQCVRFPAHDRDYLVWEYEMLPDMGPVCPSEGTARVLTGVATLGLSEVAWNNAKLKPHWVYFLDGYMVFAGRGFDCSSPEICSIHKNNLVGHVCRR
jgi:hypothetical protein